MTPKIISIFKGGEKSKYTNYRPISVLPTISKILEWCVYNQLICHLESHNMLSSEQYGFRKKRSTEIATRYIKQWIVGILQVSYSSISARHLTLSPCHQFRTSSYGISGNKKAWFTDYPFHRKMRVNYKETLSTPTSIHCGVPQGSILGLLLFLLHFNGLPSLLNSSKMVMYADDTALYYSHKDMKEIENVLFQDPCTVSKLL